MLFLEPSRILWEAETGKLRVQDQFRLHIKLKGSQDYIVKPYLKKIGETETERRRKRKKKNKTGPAIIAHTCNLAY